MKENRNAGPGLLCAMMNLACYPRAAELEVSAVSGTPKLALAPLFGTK
jgi:hypothetical protein